MQTEFLTFVNSYRTRTDASWKCRPKWPAISYNLFVCFFCFSVDVSCTCLRFQIPMHSNLKWRTEIETVSQNHRKIEILSNYREKNHLRAHLKLFPVSVQRSKCVLYIADTR